MIGVRGRSRSGKKKGMGKERKEGRAGKEGRLGEEEVKM